LVIVIVYGFNKLRRPATLISSDSGKSLFLFYVENSVIDAEFSTLNGSTTGTLVSPEASHLQFQFFTASQAANSASHVATG
jgi:hypothetical protein